MLIKHKDIVFIVWKALDSPYKGSESFYYYWLLSENTGNWSEYMEIKRSEPWIKIKVCKGQTYIFYTLNFIFLNERYMV